VKDELEVEVFRTGDYGAKGSYTPESLEAIARDYDPKRHEAPVTLDHEQKGPAFGWVRSLRMCGDRLLARLHSLSEDLVGMIRAGAYKKRSIELYRSFSETGRPYLRAVSFLGAASPEVKGLVDPTFAEDGPTETISFGADGESVAADETAGSAVEESAAPEKVGFVTSGDTDDPSEASRLAELLTEKRAGEIKGICQAWHREGRFLPVWDGLGIEAFMERLAEAEPVAFDEEAEAVSPLEWFREFVGTLPPLVPLGESAPEVFGEDPGQSGEWLPREMAGVRLDPDSLLLHRRALRKREEDATLSYAEALRSAARL
jgi:hypothetical protein